ncbi:MAG: transposase, partial [Lutibacter sp.]
MIGDKGFFSKSNIEEIDKAKVGYIIPMKRDNEIIDYKPISKLDRKGFTGYFKYHDRFIWYYSYPHVEEHRVFVFYDNQLKGKEERDYLDRIEDKKENYTIGQFKNKIKTFGTLSIYSNLKNKEAIDIYEDYKIRMNIETMYDTMKNTLRADKSYMQNREAFEGWIFINFIALQWYYHLQVLLKQKKLLKQFSPKDLLLLLSQINSIK